MVVVIRGRQFYLWRAVDSEGEVLDFLVQSRRNARAAIRLMRKLLKKQGFAPATIVTDKLRSYAEGRDAPASRFSLVRTDADWAPGSRGLVVAVNGMPAAAGRQAAVQPSRICTRALPC